ncbi:hypothetical protein OV450_8400 [Actinobacteria bacterium OV450]|nr:hypothetical protein OV450_8400 [Actinobacteria bacterium OV450]
MKKKTARISAIVVSAVALANGLAGGAAASAAAPAVASLAAPAPALKATSIAPTQGSLNVTQMQLENISATVTDAVTGQPLAGRMVKFTTAGGRELGRAYTDHTGKAAISASENLGPGTVQELLAGYGAEVQGDGEYAPVSGHAAITIGTDSGCVFCP